MALQSSLLTILPLFLKLNQRKEVAQTLNMKRAILRCHKSTFTNAAKEIPKLKCRLCQLQMAGCQKMNGRRFEISGVN
ncbi:PIG-L family deacetylase [Sesbania bispinosa]|nr:PIG-L family deacetylase [Sesbania bispinosa]